MNNEDRTTADRAAAAWTQPVTTNITFRAARDVVALIAHHPWIPGTWFCAHDVEILESAISDIKEKIADRKVDGEQSCG